MAKFCFNCGAVFKNDKQLTCPNCGHVLGEKTSISSLSDYADDYFDLEDYSEDSYADDFDDDGLEDDSSHDDEDYE